MCIKKSTAIATRVSVPGKLQRKTTTSLLNEKSLPHIHIMHAHNIFSEHKKMKQSFILKQDTLFNSYISHTYITAEKKNLWVRNKPVLKKRQRSNVYLSERLASLGIMGPALLKPHVHHSIMVLRGLKGVLNWASIMPKDAIESLTVDVNFSLTH